MGLEEEKQRYYEYAGGYTFKQPPRLDPAVEREMLRFGRDQHGDPLWRFLWAGACVVKESKTQATGVIVGDPAAVTWKNGVLTPRYLHVKSTGRQFFCYRNRKGKGRVRRTTCELAVPRGALTWVEYEYVHFGKLRWYLERKLSPEALVEAGAYQGDDPRLPRSGDYVCLTDYPVGRPLQTEDGHYFEPDMRYVEAVRAHLHAEETESLSDLLASHRARREAKLREYEETESRREWEQAAQLVIDAEREPIERRHFIAPKRPPVETGDIIPV